MDVTIITDWTEFKILEFKQQHYAHSNKFCLDMIDTKSGTQYLIMCHSCGLWEDVSDLDS